ncbi:DinB family protein [Streptomyces olivoreticuli]|uniref:DinB family protein n=1 Tax=Streptomyces blastmyceticus TaxID=68180 RepID=A0ABN0XRJ1_9ACTN|nr:DinB family protein [Streptomyces olivoreticuli]WKK26770.1 DinB family protein [Streptomyces olivoreticuli]
MPTHVIENDPADERGTLLAFLDAQRGGLRRSVLGLTEEQAALKPSASTLSLGGLLKHAIGAERSWLAMARGTAPEISHEEAMKQFESGFVLTDDESLAGLLATWEELAVETERFIRALPTLERTFPLPAAPWFPKDASVSMRWLLLHLIEELARHAGHADVIRESLDGRTAFELVAEERGD